MSEQSAVAVFSTVAQAKEALAALVRRGLSDRKVTIVTHELESKQEVHGLVSGSDQDSTGAVSGIVVGGLVGFALGAAVNGLMYYKGVNIDGGWAVIAALMAGFTAAGLIVGALVGGMSGRGVKEGRIEPFDAQLKAGRSLIVAHGTAAEMSTAAEVLRNSGALETHLNKHVTAPADTTEAL